MTDKELDEVYDNAELLIVRGRWSLIDDILEYYGNCAWRMDIDLLLAWATATNMYRAKLKNRKVFLARCMEFHKDPDLWVGLWESGSDPIPSLKKLGFRLDA